MVVDKKPRTSAGTAEYRLERRLGPSRRIASTMKFLDGLWKIKGPGGRAHVFGAGRLNRREGLGYTRNMSIHL
jgi:hypothetical protein